MLQVTSGCVVRRDPEDVFAVLSDFEQNPTWQNGMVECTFLTEPPLRVGSRYRQRARFAGRDIHSTFEVIELEPGRRVKATTIEGTFPITFTRSVEPHGEGTRVRAIVEGDASGVFRIAVPIMRAMVKRSVDRDYARLKELLES